LYENSTALGNTGNNHSSQDGWKTRRYHKVTLEQFKVTGVYDLQQADPEVVAIYARVSSSRQKEDLKRQLTFHSMSRFEIISRIFLLDIFSRKTVLV